MKKMILAAAVALLLVGCDQAGTDGGTGGANDTYNSGSGASGAGSASTNANSDAGSQQQQSTPDTAGGARSGGE